jgi:GTP cyclohydrolase I
METFTSDPQDSGRPLIQQASSVIDEQLQDAIRTVLKAIGEDPTREGLVDTPDRIVRMWRELFRGYDPTQKPKITTFENDAHNTEMVFDTGDFYSMCEHHGMPFFGQYYFAYIPQDDGRILGISKIARVVGYCSARLQLQERLAHDIIEMLSDALDNQVQGFAIVLKGMHTCKTMRGVKNKGNMCVSYFTGIFRTNPSLREEFYHLINMQ